MTGKDGICPLLQKKRRDGTGIILGAREDDGAGHPVPSSREHVHQGHEANALRPGLYPADSLGGTNGATDNDLTRTTRRR